MGPSIQTGNGWCHFRIPLPPSLDRYRPFFWIHFTYNLVKTPRKDEAEISLLSPLNIQYNSLAPPLYSLHQLDLWVSGLYPHQRRTFELGLNAISQTNQYGAWMVLVAQKRVYHHTVLTILYYWFPTFRNYKSKGGRTSIGKDLERPWYFVWLGRIHVGVMAKSRANSLAGVNCRAITRSRSWLVISSPSRPSGCRLTNLSFG